MSASAKCPMRKARVLLAVVGLVLISGATATPTWAEGSSEGAFSRVVAFHVERYPAMEIQDLYKLTFQAAMGSEHAVPDHESARQWLTREMSGLAANPGEPLTEPLSPDGALVRVNLRALAEHGLESSTVLAAFLTTAQDFRGSQVRLKSYWNELEIMAADGSIPFEEKDLRTYFAVREHEGFPAVRHSETYRDSYEPAYRVVLLDLLKPVRP